MTCTVGQKYDPESLLLIGWTDKRKQLIEQMSTDNNLFAPWFDDLGGYKGPDIFGREPVFASPAKRLF